MAASQNGANTSAEIEIEALISEVDDKEVSEVVSSIQKELDVAGDVSVSLDSMEETSKPFSDHNGTQDLTQDSINLTKPIKTEGQSSTSLHTTSPSQSLTDGGVPPTSTKPSSLQLDGLGLNNASARTPFALSPFSAGQFPAHLQLSAEEQSAMQRQASLLAVSATTKSTGEIGKAKEILTVVSKVKEFLTHLIQLAGNSGPQVKSAVQALVQKLVAATITEEEFAQKIQEDLKSKHQPGLLPFLQGSVPYLRVHLHLQQQFLKQLIEKRKQQSPLPQSPQPHQDNNNQQQPTNNQQPAVSQSSITVSSQHQQAPAVLSSAQQVSSAATNKDKPPATNPSALPNILASLSQQQQQLLRANLSKLPEEQRKIYMENFMKQYRVQLLQAAALQQQKLNSGDGARQLGVIEKQKLLIQEQQQQAALALSGQGQASNLLQQGLTKASLKVTPPVRSASPRNTKGVRFGEDKRSPAPSKHGVHEDEEDDDGVDFAGVNLKEEKAHFLPASVGETASLTCADRPFLSLTALRDKVAPLARQHGIQHIPDDTLLLLSHAVEERLKNVVEKVTLVNRHRMDSLKDESGYEVTSDVRGQLKVLESIDRISASRKQEREKEKIMKAARSRSKQDDPELAKMKEQAKLLQQAQEREIHTRAANVTALAAIGRRKRTTAAAFGDSTTGSEGAGGGSVLGEGEEGGSSTGVAAASMFATPTASRSRQKRRISARDVTFILEQERETKKSHLLYKSFLK